MKAMYVSDDHITINIQGLRYVKRTSGGSLEWGHKGSEQHYYYKDQTDADEMYKRLREALIQENAKCDSK